MATTQESFITWLKNLNRITERVFLKEAGEQQQTENVDISNNGNNTENNDSAENNLPPKVSELCKSLFERYKSYLPENPNDIIQNALFSMQLYGKVLEMVTLNPQTYDCSLDMNALKDFMNYVNKMSKEINLMKNTMGEVYNAR